MKGLDDERDYLRMWHGLWHCAASALSSALLLGTHYYEESLANKAKTD